MSAAGAIADWSQHHRVTQSPLVDPPGESAPTDAPRWYVAYTNVRHEKSIAAQLEDRRIANFLPTYHSVRRWKDRRRELDLPLFPGYLFVQATSRDRLRVLQVPGVVRFVSFGGRPVPIGDEEIEILRNAALSGFQTEPHPYLTVGRRVRVKYGPLAGLEGILVRKKDRFRVVISIDLIMRSVATEVQVSDLE